MLEISFKLISEFFSYYLRDYVGTEPAIKKQLEQRTQQNTGVLNEFAAAQLTSLYREIYL